MYLNGHILIKLFKRGGKGAKKGSLARCLNVMQAKNPHNKRKECGFGSKNMAGRQAGTTKNDRNAGGRIPNRVVVDDSQEVRGENTGGDWIERSDLTIMDEVESDDESRTTNEPVMWIKGLQMRIRTMEGENNALKEENDKMKTDAEKATSEMLGRAQVQ
jgi:hypothetical protein